MPVTPAKAGAQLPSAGTKLGADFRQYDGSSASAVLAKIASHIGLPERAAHWKAEAARIRKVILDQSIRAREASRAKKA